MESGADTIVVGSGAFFVVGGCPRVITFDTRLFVDWLLPVTPFRPRCNDLAELETEIRNMVYCVLYFALVDPLQPRGGPVLADTQFFPGCDTAADALRVSRPLPLYEYREHA